MVDCAKGAVLTGLSATLSSWEQKIGSKKGMSTSNV